MAQENEKINLQIILTSDEYLNLLSALNAATKQLLLAAEAWRVNEDVRQEINAAATDTFNLQQRIEHAWLDAQKVEDVALDKPRGQRVDSDGRRKKVIYIFGKEFEITNSTWMQSLTCPLCGASECHPSEGGRVLIRGFKVDNLSQCMVCAGYYDPDTLVVRSVRERPAGWEDKGWF